LYLSRFHPTGGGARHHPASGIHLLRGESNAWYHATVLMDAIYMIEHDMERGMKRDDQIAGYRRVLDSLHPSGRSALDLSWYNSNPQWKTCQRYYALEAKVECYNDFRPKWNPRLSLHNQLVNKGN